MKIGFWGNGKMAQGILAAMPDRDAVTLSSIEDNRNVEIARTCELIFLAVRPQDVAGLAAEVREFLREGQTIVSIVAGKTLAKLREAFGDRPRFIRVMPNLALRAGAGMCALTESDERVERILGAAGATVVLAEKDFDAVTALSGSGPAYFAFMEQAMAKAGERLGLDAAVARLLAEQTMFGTAKFLRESQMNLREFIAGVCTKGGTTAAGMEKLAADSTFENLVYETLKAASDRSKELA